MQYENLLKSAGFLPDLLHHPSCWFGHMPFASWVTRETKPKVFVELGTHCGHSYFAFCQAVVEAGLLTKCYAVDAWRGDEHAGFYGEDVFAGVQAHNSRYAGFSSLLKMNFDDCVSLFSNSTIDMIHIDGLHTYSACRHDFETWLPKLSPGAIVMIHDINAREKGFGVWKLWEELQAKYPNNIEFAHSYGLGVLQLDGGIDTQRLDWLWQSSTIKDELVRYFASLGQNQNSRYNVQLFRSQIASLNQRISEQERSAVEAVAAVRVELNEKEKRIESLNEEIKSLGLSSEELDLAYTRLLGSTCWRITKPIRILGDALKFFFRSIKSAASVIKHHGGLSLTLVKAFRLMRREGLPGFKHGLKKLAKSQQLLSGAYPSFEDGRDYNEWVAQHDTLTDEMRTAMRAHLLTMNNEPRISVLMPTYNSDPSWLVEAINSVQHQLYQNWELCIADDASTSCEVREILDKYASEDTRIKVVLRDVNGHISAASNSALDAASGEWVALLDHDDVLSEHALFWVAVEIDNHPDVCLIYSDEDKLDAEGRRYEPYFKCDWNRELFYSHNMISHLGVYRADLLREIGGFRRGLEGSQDYDIALRYIENIPEATIRHIPRVLYHWRAHQASTAASIQTKPYALIASVKAVNEHFARLGVHASCEPNSFGMHRVRYELPSEQPLVSLIIPTKNAFGLIKTCIESVLTKTSYSKYEVLIVDNGSDDPAVLKYFQTQASNEKIRIIRDARPFNYSALNNAAVREARGELICLLNNDIEVIANDWLSEMVSIALQDGVGAVGARLLYPDDTIQHAGVLLGIGGVASHAHYKLDRYDAGYFGRSMVMQSLSAVTGACLVIRKSIYDQVGGLNEGDLAIAFNDIDFCLRVKSAGYRNVWTPYAELYHHESATRGTEDTPEKHARFVSEVDFMVREWGDLLLNDPAYSPNLTLQHENFGLAWPPRVGTSFRYKQLPADAVPISRAEKALMMVDRKGVGLEIGPSHNPIAPKRDGFNVHVLDHATAETLREKYKGHEKYGVKLENIEEVDFVWQGEPFRDLVGKTHCYDWILASHVIEHTPDLVTFLSECEELLKPEGVISLIIPDKRYCFDFFNPLTSTGELLDAYEQKRTRHCSGKVFDHFSNAAKRGGQIAWDKSNIGSFMLMHSMDEAQRMWGKAKKSMEYIDVHNWRFTPASFRLMLADLRSLGLTKFGIIKEFETDGCEFYVTLSTKPLQTHQDRLLLQRRVVAENSLGRSLECV